MAIGAMQYYKEQNIQIPNDLSIIGFDNIESDLSQRPPLTTMSVPKIDLGQNAFQLLMQFMTKQNFKSKKILVPVELIIRGTTKEK